MSYQAKRENHLTSMPVNQNNPLKKHDFDFMYKSSFQSIFLSFQSIILSFLKIINAH